LQSEALVALIHPAYHNIGIVKPYICSLIILNAVSQKQSDFASGLRGVIAYTVLSMF